MKKNFKKSKFVILPALATLVLTGVASVTGTVAWFTANRTASASLTTIKAETMDGALKVAAEAGVGTTNITGGDNAKSIQINGSLTHGSYDAKAKPLDDNGGHLYVANIDNDGEKDVITGYSDLSNLKGEANNTAVPVTHKWQAGTKDNTTVWYGVSWTLKFSQVNNNSTNEDNVLLFNPAGAKFSDEVNSDTIKGLRIALMTDDKVLVVGGDDTATHIDSGTKAETTRLPTFSNYVKAGAASTKAVDYDKLTNNSNLLGTIPSETDKTLDLTVVAWFEGTDENVANGKELTTNATAGLSFYSVKQTKQSN